MIHDRSVWDLKTKSPTKAADRRGHQRVPVKLYADLHWEAADGQMKFARTRVLDISEGGIGLSLPAGSLSVGVSVHLRIEQFGLSEYGMVHHARGDGTFGVKLRLNAATKQEVERWKKCVGALQSA
jgi:hypothetical protein